MFLGGDGLALHPKACLHELMCIAVWLLVEGGGCRVSLSLLLLSGVPGEGGRTEEVVPVFVPLS